MFTPPVSSDRPEGYLEEIRNLCIQYKYAIQNGYVSQEQRDSFAQKYMIVKESAERAFYYKYKGSPRELKESMHTLGVWATEFRALHLRANAFKHLQEENSGRERLLDTIQEGEDGT